MIKFYDNMGASQGISVLSDVVDALDFWQDGTPVGVGDIARSSTNSMIYAVAQTAGNTGTVEPVWGNSAGVTLTDNTVTWLVKDIRIADGAFKADKLTTPRKINGVDFDGTADITLPSDTANDKSYIANGLKVSSVDGKNVSISSGTANINGQNVKCAGGSIVLDSKKASLLYMDSNANIGKINANPPAINIDNNTVGLWIFNQQIAGANIPNSAVGQSFIAVDNDLIPHGGLASVDGWFDNAIQGDGTSGYYTASNTTNFPLGANKFEINSEFTYYAGGGTSGNTTLLNIGGTNTNIQIYTTGDYIYVFEMGTGVNTNYPLKNGVTYLITIKYDGSILSIYINGTLILNVSVTLAIAALNLYVLSASASVNFSKFIIHFLEIRNALRSDDLTGQLANSLMLPCFYDKPSAAYPIISDADKATAYHEWKLDETSGTTLADSNMTSPLNGTATGTTIVDSPLGLGKARNVAQSEKINVGSYAFGTEYTIVSAFSYKSNGTENDIVRNYNGTVGTAFAITSAKKLTLFQNGLSAISSVIIDEGKPVFCAATVKLGLISLYPNSKIPEITPAAITATASQPLNLFSANDNSTMGIGGISEYVAIFPRALSQAEISKFYDAIMTTGRRNIIDDIVPSNAVSLGFIRTNSSKAIEYNDTDYMYGRREKANGGNRKVFLGWKYFNSTSTLSWNNPFGTRKLKLYFTLSVDTKGTLETRITERFADSTINYGIYTGYGSATDAIKVYVNQGGAAIIDGSWRTYGYIGCYAEVLEDYKGA